MEPKDLSANWKKLQATLKASKPDLVVKPTNGLKRKRATETSARPAKKSDVQQPPDMACLTTVNEGLSTTTDIGKYIAIDCEMVGVGPGGRESALARVSLVNFNGVQIYDSYVKPKEPVMDWRTPVSGIAPKHMVTARSFEVVQMDVMRLLQDRVLVGHAIRNDLDALLLSHPKREIRDTARHQPYRQLAGGSSPRLKMLAESLLGLDIQVGEHSSVEDARACMMLFRRDKDAFESEHTKKWPTRTALPNPTNDEHERPHKPRKHKKHKKKKR